MSGASHAVPSHPPGNPTAEMDGPGPADDNTGDTGAAADTGTSTTQRSVERQALIERISELEDGAVVREKAVRKEVKADLAKLDEKLGDMPPDKALKHIRSTYHTALTTLHTVTAEATARQTELDKVSGCMAGVPHHPCPYPYPCPYLYPSSSNEDKLAQSMPLIDTFCMPRCSSSYHCIRVPCLPHN